MKKPLISVIVPVYNVEKYLSRCLDSILNQSYPNIEIVVVDDCSTDNSRIVIDKYRKYKQIKIIYNKTNKGLSYTRNVGIKESSGKYISFIDSDDYVSDDFYEKMMKSLLEDKSDIAICDIKLVYENNNSEIINKAYTDTPNKFGFINNGLAASSCNKIFLKELFNDYLFEVGKYNEDIAVVIPLIIKAKKISYVEDVYYYYFQRNGSIQNKSFSKSRFDIFNAVDLTLHRIRDCDNYENIKESLIYNQIIVLLLFVIIKEKSFFRRNSILKKYNNYIKKYDIYNNKFFNDMLNKSSRKTKIFYKTLVKLSSLNFSFLENHLITLYKIIYSRIHKKVTKECNINDLIALSKKQKNMKQKLKVSVIIPNYNYKEYLYERLYSILSQNYKLYEIIILDDCSTDNSTDEISKITEALNEYINIKTIFNSSNSGSPFKQWKKGFEAACGEYIWIAEADDYCSNKLLKRLIKPIIKDNNIVLSYCDTAFIDSNGFILMKSVVPQIDLQKTNHWKHDYINDGVEEILNYSFLNCTIANVSSCIIKKQNYDKYLELSSKYKQAGDWLFYVNVLSNGKVAYNHETMNYYRLHGNNVSSTYKKEKHIDEIKKIYNYINENFRIKKQNKVKQNERINFLKDVWKVK